MKKGHQKIKRATKPDSIRLAKILLHKAIVTKKLAAVEYEQQIHAIAEGKETFSLDTYKELKRELTTLRNLVKEVHSDLGNEGLRKLKEETRIKYLTIFDYHNNRTTRKVLDRFRKREEKEEFDTPLFSYKEVESNNNKSPTPDEFEQERFEMLTQLNIFLQETI